MSNAVWEFFVHFPTARRHPELIVVQTKHNLFHRRELVWAFDNQSSNIAFFFYLPSVMQFGILGKTLSFGSVVNIHFWAEYVCLLPYFIFLPLPCEQIFVYGAMQTVDPHPSKISIA